MNKSIESFVLVDGFVEVSNNSIQVKDRRKKVKNELISQGGWLTVIGVVLIHNTIKKLINGFSEKIMDYVSFFLQGLGALCITGIIIYLIFKHKWKKNIEISELIKVEIDADDTFDYDVTLITSDKRSKLLTFRKLENQLEPFTETLKKRNTRIEIKHL